MIANPPYGKDWKRDEAAVRAEHDRGGGGRFAPGLPRISDGQLLFLLHMLSHAYFYEYRPPRPLEEIEADIHQEEKEILEMLREVTGQGWHKIPALRLTVPVFCAGEQVTQNVGDCAQFPTFCIIRP